MHGSVTEAGLVALLARADLAINLHNPTQGEASPTQLRLWNHALPSIVSRAGWYASLPAATVATVRPGDEVDGLRQLLGAFLADPARFREMGRSGRELLLRSHAPKDYVSGLLEFAEELARDASPSIPVPLGGWGAFALRERVREATIKALAGWADQGPLHRMFKERVNKAMHELASSQRVSSRRPARRGTPLTISQHPLAAAA